MKFVNEKVSWIYTYILHGSFPTSICFCLGEIKNAPADKWIKGNPGQYGFYRVNYDAQGWKDLTSQMKIHHKVSAINQAIL